MKPQETGCSNQTAPDEGNRDSVDAQASYRSSFYHKVLDGRKQPIRGLWKRGNHFYARLTTLDTQTGRRRIQWARMDGVTTVPQAQAELRRLVTAREKGNLPTLHRTPKFGEFADSYLAYHEGVVGGKRRKTLQTERGHLKRWKEHLGDTRLDKINLAMVHDFIEKRQLEGLSGRTINLAVVCLRNVLKRAIEKGHIQRLPTENLAPQKYIPRKRALVTMADIEKLCEAAWQAGDDGAPLKNAQQLCDYVKLLAFCGARRNEALRVRWQDVDWGNRQLTIGWDGQTKSRKSRVVDFNPQLEAHLKDMLARRAPDSQWLFPSPQRGAKDIPALTFVESLRLARSKAGMEFIGFHHLRHFFASYCVMAGVDFMTIAAWLGHQDGGILVGKVYGHLADSHKQAQALKVNFGPALVESQEVANQVTM